MMKQIIRNWTLIVLAVIFASCSEEYLNSDEDTNTLADKPMVVLNIPDIVGETVGQANTRIAGTPDENNIDRVAVVILRKPNTSSTWQEDSVYYTYNKTTDLEMITADDGLIDMAGDGKSVKIYLKKIRPSEGDMVYLFCNPRFYSEEEIILSAKPASLINRSMYIDHALTSNPNGYLVPMAGKFEWSDNGNSCAIIRSVAKVKFSLADGLSEQYQDGGYYFMNYINKGTMLYEHFPTVDSNDPLYVSDTNGGRPYSLSDITYIYEYPHSTRGKGISCKPDQYNTNRACIVLVLNNKYYRLDFYNRDTKEYFNIKRNHYYNFKITHINSEGYDTPDEALKSHASNLEYQVNVVDDKYDWVKQIFSNGQYAIYTDREVDYVIPDVKEDMKVNSTVMQTVGMINAMRPDGTTGSTLPETNKITVTGEGITLVAPTDKKIYTGSDALQRDITLQIDDKKFNNGGTLNLQLGNIRKSYAICRTIPVDAHYNTYEIPNVISARILNEEKVPWLELSKNTESKSNLTYKKKNMARAVSFQAPTTLYIHIEENTSQVDKEKDDKKFRYGAVTIAVKNGANIDTLNYAFQQHALRYVGTLGGMQDSYPYSRGLAVEQLEEDGEQPWGFNNTVMGDSVIDKNNIKKDDYLNIPIRKNGWAATKKLAENIATSGHPDGKYAARICYEKNRDIDGNGILTADEIKWYLPAFDQIWDTCRKLALSGYYWSTTESAANSAWIGRNSSTYYTEQIKSENNHIRCVRDM